MSENRDDKPRNRFLLTNLTIIIIFVLTIALLLSLYPIISKPPRSQKQTITSSFTPSNTHTPIPSITAIHSPTFSPHPSLTATITPTPSISPTPTLTPSQTGLPTITPARPVKGENIYSLREWDVEDTIQLVEYFNSYPNSLNPQERGKQDENYFAAHYFTTITQKEGILRFPYLSISNEWKWGLALNKARIGDPSAGESYAKLITEALNRGDTLINDLEEWFTHQQPVLSLTQSQITAPPNYLNAHLIEIGGHGSTFILILESINVFASHVLISDFDFVHNPQFNSFNSDVTGDGLEEIVIYSSRSQWSDSRTPDPPHIFSMGTVPPVELPYSPIDKTMQIGVPFENQWSVVENSFGYFDIQFFDTVFPACPVTIIQNYRWNGDMFNIVQRQFNSNPQNDTLSYCKYIADHAEQVWGPGPTVQLLEQILPYWPPDHTEDGTPFPDDARDEWLYRLAINHALLGNYEQAVESMSEIISSPSTINSKWISPAKAFLNQYQSNTDVYQACKSSSHCNPETALNKLVDSIPSDKYTTALTFLWEHGVEQRSSGYFDFDGDDVKEIWFTVRHQPGEKLEFWTLVDFPSGIVAFRVDSISTDQPTLTNYEKEEDITISILDSKIAFSIIRIPQTLQPFIIYPNLPEKYPNIFYEKTQSAHAALFSGANPKDVKKDLLLLQDEPGLLCENTWSCDEYYYLLGLSAELSGDNDTAIDAYLRLWWDYQKSPFTTMARLKLKGISVLPSATPTSTPTPTLTLTPTLTVTGTPPTSTPTVSGTPPTYTPTSTTTVTPTSSPTATPSTPYPAPESNETPYP